ncbi:MAG TPA: hypothetical protein VNA15_03200 [Candidatus Angelobacter sp.]|nr:hypothetical protein [Candidatus Angelobacter sp.]
MEKLGNGLSGFTFLGVSTALATLLSSLEHGDGQYIGYGRREAGGFGSLQGIS